MKPAHHIVIPDVQAKPGVPLDHLMWIGKYIAEKRPDVIVCIGDFADMESLSSYDSDAKKAFEQRSYQGDVDVARRAMDLLLAPIWKLRSYSPRMVLTLGNHENRIPRAVEADPKLRGTVDMSHLRYEDAGWDVYPFLIPVKINGIYYSHYFPQGKFGKPPSSAARMLAKFHDSCIAGHAQGRDIAFGHRGDGSEIIGIIAGSCYLHDEGYMPWPTNRHWRGIIRVYPTGHQSDGETWVSLDFLRRKFACKSGSKSGPKARSRSASASSTLTSRSKTRKRGGRLRLKSQTKWHKR